jgi:hypothetical protein
MARLIPLDEMALLPSHEMRLQDSEAQGDKISPEMAKLRAPHLALLKPLQDLALELSPLPISYDVMRLQAPYFHEFTFTEGLGCFWITPQSSELAARVVAAALEDHREWPFKPADHLPLRDKYQSAACKARPRKVAFLPGTNIFHQAVSPEILLRLLHEDEDVVLKPHPLTNDELKRYLGRGIMGGYSRVLKPSISASALLPHLKVAYVTTSSEMGLYAVLEGIEIRNITRLPFEPRGTYTPFYRLLWGLSKKKARARLIHLLNSPLSGFFHPDDPDVREKMSIFFEHAMRLRQPFRPFVQEFTPDRWADLLSPSLPQQPPAPRPTPTPQKDPPNVVG